MNKNSRTLAFLCNITFWDGYLNFGLTTLLVLYLTSHYHLSDQRAYSIFGIFLTVGYTMPLIGGWLADRFLGAAKAVLYSNGFIIAGCLLLSETHHYATLLIALFLITFGFGLIKANTNGLLTKLYQENTLARDQGYTWLYAMMNVGAIAGPILLSWLGSQYSWTLAFRVSALFFAFSLLLYWIEYPRIYAIEKPQLQLSFELALWQEIPFMICAAAVIVGVLTTLVLVPHLFMVFIIGIIALVLYAFYAEWRHTLHGFWKKCFILLCFYVFIMLFFISEFQVGGALALFTTRQIDTFHWGHFSLSSQSLAALLPLFVAVGALFVNGIMRPTQNQSPFVRLMSRVLIGMVFASIAFFCFFDSATSSIHNHFGAMLSALVMGYLFLGFAEIFIAPTVFSAIGYAIGKTRQSTFMGVNYLFASLAGYFAGLVSSFSQIATPDLTDHMLMGVTYAKVFLLLAIVMLGIAGTAGIVLWAFRIFKV